MSRVKQMDVWNNESEHREKACESWWKTQDVGELRCSSIACCSLGSSSAYNILVKRDVDLQDGGAVKNTPHFAHTGHKTPSAVVGFLERVLVRSKVNDDKQSRFLTCWALGYKDADIITLMKDESVRYNGSWELQFRRTQ